MAAAKRLFKDVEDVMVEEEEEGSKRVRSGGGKDGVGCDGQGEEAGKSSVWAGRRLVTDWSSFLRGCEREGVASV